MTNSLKRFSSWRKALLKATFFWLVLILADLAIAYFFSSHQWSNAEYFFGNNLRITLGVLMFIEGAILCTLGLVWASGSMETVFQGGNLKTNPYYRTEDWKQRNEQTEKENIIGKILMLAGGPILIASFVVVMI